MADFLRRIPVSVVLDENVVVLGARETALRVGIAQQFEQKR